MIKNKWIPVAVWTAFTVAELAVYITFLVSDVTGAGSATYVKYAGVLLCLACAVFNAFVYGTDGALLSLALAFTAVSDLFILVLGKYYEVGVSTFIVVQCTYFFRIYYFNGKKPYVSLAVRVALIAAVIITLACTGSLIALTALVAVYIVMLLVNCAEAFVYAGKSPKNLAFAAGLLLFLCCDVCVGLNNFGSVLGVALPANVIAFVSVAMWAFYLPSQVLIVLSAHKNGRKKEVCYEK